MSNRKYDKDLVAVLLLSPILKEGGKWSPFAKIMPKRRL